MVKLVLPKDGEQLSFEHFNRSMKVPMIVYADFEAFTSTASEVTTEGGIEMRLLLLLLLLFLANKHEA